MIIINHLRLDADDWMMHHHLDEREGGRTEKKSRRPDSPVGWLESPNSHGTGI